MVFSDQGTMLNIMQRSSCPHTVYNLAEGQVEKPKCRPFKVTHKIPSQAQFQTEEHLMSILLHLPHVKCSFKSKVAINIFSYILCCIEVLLTFMFKMLIISYIITWTFV